MLQLSIGDALLAGIIFVSLTVMITMLIISERERKAAERAKRRSYRKRIEREFERQMHNLEFYGNIHGANVIYLENRRNKAI